MITTAFATVVALATAFVVFYGANRLALQAGFFLAQVGAFIVRIFRGKK